MSIRDTFISKVELSEATQIFGAAQCSSRTSLRINHETGQCSLSDGMTALKVGAPEVSSALANNHIVIPGGPGSLS